MNDKNTKIISSSQFINNFGTAMTRISLVILISTWFSNPIYIGLYSFFLFVPGIVFASQIGSLVDNCRNLKRLLVETLVLSLLSVLAILFIFCINLRSFPLLVLLAVLYSVLCDFYTPIISKITMIIFDKREYMKINADITTAMTSANLFSGVLVTVLLGLINFKGVFEIDILSYVIVTSLILFLEVPDNDKFSSKNKENRNVLVSGFDKAYVFIRENKYLISPLIGAVIFNIILAPLDVYLTQIATINADNKGIVGILDSLFSFGFLISSIGYRFLSSRIRIHQFISLSLLQVPLAILLMGNTRSLMISAFGLIILGASIPLYNISLKTVFQNKIPEDDFGAISNCLYALINLSQPIGLLGVPTFISFCGIQKYSITVFIIYISLGISLIIANKISTELDV